MLSHRQNTNQRQRIVAFVASPLDEQSARELPLLAKGLRKNGLAVDLVLLGGEAASQETALRAFIDAVDIGPDGEPERRSRLLIVPVGQPVTEAFHAFPEFLTYSSGGAGGAGTSPTGGAGGDFDDGDIDPELAMALKLSLEEEMARQARSGQAVPAAEQSKEENGMEEDQEDPELSKAIAMSMERP